MAKRVTMDWTLFLSIICLVAVGLVMIYSASSITAEDRYDKPPHYFVTAQAVFAIGGFVVLLILRRFNYRQLRGYAWAFGPVSIALVLVLIAIAVDPRHRWIPLGIINLQPSELAKPVVVIFLANFITWRQAAINDTRYTLLPAAGLLGLLILLVSYSDLGTAVVLAVTVVMMFMVAGLSRKYLLVAAGLSAIFLVGAIFAKPYRLRRTVEAVDPQYTLLDKVDFTGRIKPYILSSPSVSDTGYQARQARIAHGSGGIWGFGLMHGRQKHFYLPESHTDFIYAVVGEELGLWGTSGILVGFLVLVWRGLRIALLTPDDFGRLLALGFVFTIGFQALFNISVVLGLGPTKGIPLPLVSYGGSSLMATLASLGILMNVGENVG